MPFKINISEKSGKTYKLEKETEELIGKSLHDKIQGKELLPDLEGYEFEITGASDKAGFPALENVEGIGLKKVLLGYGKGMHRRPRKEGKKKVSNPRPKGLRLRKTARGRVISPEIVQINLKILKEGGKKLEEVFPEQNKKESSPESNKPQEGESGANTSQKGGAPKEEAPTEQEAPKKEVKEEQKPVEEKKEERPKETKTEEK